jgi:hypothetical protein
MKKPQDAYVYLEIPGVRGRVELYEPSTGSRAIIEEEGEKVKVHRKDLSLIRRVYNVAPPAQDTGRPTVLGE